MTSIRLLWLLLCLIWLLFEAKLIQIKQIDENDVLAMESSSRRWLWITLLASLALAMLVKTLEILPIPIAYLPRQALALVLFLVGIGLRITAINRLKHLFTTHVTIQQEHCLITDGPYRWVRHPAYSGILLALFAAGIAMGDFFALFLITIPPLMAFNYRITIEEKLLSQTFATDYLEYCQRTKKLIPWLL